MNREIKIITLGDIFRNIETEEKAFKFLNYIQNLQEENENRISESLSYDLATARVKELENKITNLQEEIKQYQKELEKADSITQSCIFQGKQNSEISFRNCLNKVTDYKSRIDEAIKYIEEKGRLKYYPNELLNILQGENNDI